MLSNFKQNAFTWRMSEIGTHKKLGGNVDMNNTKEQTLPGKSFFFIAALPPFSMRIFNY